MSTLSKPLNDCWVNFGRILSEGWVYPGYLESSGVNVLRNIQISNSLGVQFFPWCARLSNLVSTRWHSQGQWGEIDHVGRRRRRKRNHHAQGTWQERRRSCWYLCSHVYVSIPFARTRFCSRRCVLRVYKYSLSLLPAFFLSLSFCRCSSTAARTRYHVLKLKSRRKRDAWPHFSGSDLLHRSFFFFFSYRLRRFPWRSWTPRANQRATEKKQGREREGKARIRRCRRRDDTEGKRYKETKRFRSEEEETSNEGKMEESLKAL